MLALDIVGWDGILKIKESESSYKIFLVGDSFIFIPSFLAHDMHPKSPKLDLGTVHLKACES